MRKVLPLATPIITSYSKHAHIFSILGAHEDNYYPWLYTHYMQLCVPDDYRVFRVDYIGMERHANIPNLFTFEIEREVAISIGNGIMGFVKYAIDNGYYICLEVKAEHILAYDFDISGYHEPLLYGYDDEKEEVYVADIDMDGKYFKGSATYSKIVNAVDNKLTREKSPKNNQNLDILCMKYRDSNESFVFDKNTCITFLKYYMTTVNTCKTVGELHGEIRRKERSTICGIGIYVLLKKHLQYVGNEADELLDRRGFKVVLEHKKLLQNMLRFLLGECWEEEFPIEAKLLQTVIKIAAMCFQLCLKYNVSKDKGILKRICKYATNLEEFETILFPSLIKIIETLE